MAATKHAVFTVKAAPDESAGAGIIRAVASVFGNVDSYGDVVMPEAFDETLAEFAASGDPVPVVWSHGSSDPFNHIGYCTEIKATETGLEFTAQLDIEDNPTAAQAYRLMKGRRVKQFSFAYSVLEATRGERDGEYVTELRKLKLFEVGPTLVGANQSTELLDVKSAPAPAVEAKAGRKVSAKNEELIRKAHEALGELLASLTEVESDAKAADNGPAAKDQEPSQAKSEEPPAKSSATQAAELETYLSAINLELEITK
ncbi:HK97 family phage prohead protease [Glutamicibacter sp. NPDC087583]|uniref:HK97 family phage prohead protease n=1 Tax=Glutamicibacter sp. NPDC087583 TaxID=3363995 RepID=UPI00382765E1